MRARVENEPHEEAWHLLKANQWNESHQVMLRHLAADAIINGMLPHLNSSISILF